jgi:GT2 family glycosyltransferase
MNLARGEVIAYTDDDCFADPDWLTLLVSQLQRSGAAAVGGPNLTPEDGWLPACVAAAPGQPAHVLESDQVAEHIPGCNMAFRREALEAINGFDPQYRKAGDDVDVGGCSRRGCGSPSPRVPSSGTTAARTRART